MDEVAVAASVAHSFVVLAAFGFSEVGHGTVLGVDLDVVEVLPYLFFIAERGLLLSSKLDVQVAHHMVSNIVCHQHVQNLSVFTKLDKYFFKKVFEMLRSLKKFFLWYLQSIGERDGGSWVLIQLKK